MGENEIRAMLEECVLSSYATLLIDLGVDSIAFFLTLLESEIREAAAEVGMKIFHTKKFVQRWSSLKEQDAPDDKKQRGQSSTGKDNANPVEVVP